MNKSARSVKNSLKFKAEPKDGVLTVRIGVKKYVLPVQARMLAGEEYLFLSVPASTELYRLGPKTLDVFADTEDAEAAYEQLKPEKKKRSRKRGGGDLPSDIASALKSLPEGYKVGYGPDGKPRLVRTRARRK
ncbi:MAG: hypothetical protein ACK4XJ_06170 [Fimbriimonadaceae bacterium]